MAGPSPAQTGEVSQGADRGDPESCTPGKGKHIVAGEISMEAAAFCKKFRRRSAKERSGQHAREKQGRGVGQGLDSDQNYLGRSGRLPGWLSADMQNYGSPTGTHVTRFADRNHARHFFRHSHGDSRGYVIYPKGHVEDLRKRTFFRHRPEKSAASSGCKIFNCDHSGYGLVRKHRHLWRCPLYTKQGWADALSFYHHLGNSNVLLPSPKRRAHTGCR